jgi:hypothetical protein
MSGKRRRPYVVKKTVGWHYDEAKDKMIQDVDKISEKDACVYLEYMLFEKSKNVYVQIPDCYQKKWKESPQWNQLFNLWRDIK